MLNLMLSFTNKITDSFSYWHSCGPEASRSAICDSLSVGSVADFALGLAKFGQRGWESVESSQFWMTMDDLS